MDADRSAECLDPCSDPEWAAFVETQGQLFQSPPWLRAMRDAMGVTPRAVVLRDAGGRISAGLVVGHVGGAVGDRLSTFPFSDYCGPIGVTDESAWRSVSAPAFGSGLPFQLRVPENPLLAADERLIERGRAAWHVVDVGADEEEQWARLASGARQNVRRARQCGVTIEVGSELADVLEFHRLHTWLRRHKYGMLAQPPEYFTALHEQFGDDLLVISARLAGETVAAVLLLRWGSGAYYKFNASLPAAGPVRANELAMWAAIRASRDRWSAETLDLGLSDLDQPGLVRYKRKYADREGELVSYSRPVTSDERRATEVRRLMTDLTDVLTGSDASADLLSRASSVLYRNFC